MPRLRVALIGLGMAVGPHAKSLLDLKDKAEVAWAVSPSAARREAFAKNFPFPISGDVDKVLEDKSVDAVLVLTPPNTHLDIVRRAAKAGKHVLVEKPLATDPAHGHELVRLATEKKLALACGHQERLVFEAMGLFGLAERPTLIESVREGPWTGRSADVSVTLDLMVHDLDLALRLLGGAPERVSATARREKGATADEIEAKLDFGGAEARFVSSRIAEGRKRTMRAVYPSGEMRIDFLARTFENTTPFALNARFAETAAGADPLGENVRRFVDAALGQAPRPAVDGAEALAVLELALAVDAAAGMPSVS